MKNREFRALLTAALTAALVAGSFSSVPAVSYATDAQAVTVEASASSPAKGSVSQASHGAAATKDETVYAKVDGSGNVTSVTVSDQLKNIGDDSRITDVSILKDIENVKGNEAYQISGDRLIWSVGGKDICYQGTTDQKLPVGIRITYKLDGEEMGADKLEGRSGHLIVRYEYQNTTADDGEYVPFVMVTGLILDSKKFSNVAVTNGKVISDGDRSMAIGMGLPQMKEALGTDSLNVPDYFEVETDVTDYEATEEITVATNSLFNGLETDKFDSVSDLKSSMNQLQGASAQLVDGTGELKGGLDTLLTSSGTLIDGVNALAGGGRSLIAGTGTLLSGGRALADGSKNLADGTGQLVSGTKALKDGTEELANGAASAASQTGSGSELADGATALTNGIEAMGGQLAQGFQDLVTGTGTLSAGIEGIQQGVSGLKDSVNTNGSNIVNALDNVTALAQNLPGCTPTDPGTSISAFSVANGNGGTDSAIHALSALLGRDDISEEAQSAISQAIGSLQSDQAARQSSASTLDAEISGRSAAFAAASDAASSANHVVAAAQGASAAASAYISGISDGTDVILQSLDSLSQGADALKENITASSVKVSAGLSQLDNGSKSLSGGIGTLNQGLAGLSAGASRVNAGSRTLDEKMGEADSGAKGVAAGASQVVAGASELDGGVGALANGIGALQSGSGTLLGGVRQLDGGAEALNNGMLQFNEDGIEKLVSVFNGDIEGLSEKLNTMMDASKSYKNFSGIPEGMDGEVKFIFVSGR